MFRPLLYIPVSVSGSVPSSSYCSSIIVMFRKSIILVKLIAFAAIVVPARRTSDQILDTRDCVVDLDVFCAGSVDTYAPIDDSLLAFNTFSAIGSVEQSSIFTDPLPADLGTEETNFLFPENDDFYEFQLAANARQECTCPGDISAPNVRYFPLLFSLISRFCVINCCTRDAYTPTLKVMYVILFESISSHQRKESNKIGTLEQPSPCTYQCCRRCCRNQDDLLLTACRPITSNPKCN